MWQGLGDPRKRSEDARARYNREMRAGYSELETNAWGQIPLATKILLAVLGSLLILFLVLILTRKGSSRISWFSILDRFGWGRVNELQVSTPRPGAPVAVVDRDTEIFNGPGEEYEVIGILPGGQRAEIVAESQDSRWWAISVPSAKDGLGWISANAITIENASGLVNIQGAMLPGSRAEPGIPHLIALANVEIQAGPSRQGPILGYLENGQRADVLGVSEDGQWWAIKMPFFETGQGWVSGDRVAAENVDEVAIVPYQNSVGTASASAQENSLVTAIANVNIRSGPGMDYKIIGLLEAGQTAQAIGIASDRFWLEIKMPGAEGQQGWVSVSYISSDEFGSLAGLAVIEPRPEGGASNVPIPTPGSPMLTALYVVNIRSGPGTQFDILGSLVQGQKAEVVGVSADGLWWVIRVTGVNNDQGWVASRYVEAENTSEIPILR